MSNGFKSAMIIDALMIYLLAVPEVPSQKADDHHGCDTVWLCRWRFLVTT
ncbi:hypothetical protein O9929_23615 [Vibrio lentus]|nr:hypothetical protein [Vibrio lentus]